LALCGTSCSSGSQTSQPDTGKQSIVSISPRGRGIVQVVFAEVLGCLPSIPHICFNARFKPTFLQSCNTRLASRPMHCLVVFPFSGHHVTNVLEREDACSPMNVHSFHRSPYISSPLLFFSNRIYPSRVIHHQLKDLPDSKQKATQILNSQQNDIPATSPLLSFILHETPRSPPPNAYTLPIHRLHTPTQYQRSPQTIVIAAESRNPCRFPNPLLQRPTAA
jgi:hypothetical protein